jgi:hypothetical protein
MEPFITFRDTDRQGNLQYYILQRDYPHYCGMIVEKRSDTAIMQMPVAKHHLYVEYAGTIRGSYVPGHKDVMQEIEHVFRHMAEWYYEHRIVPDPKRFKKWAVS